MIDEYMKALEGYHDAREEYEANDHPGTWQRLEAADDRLRKALVALIDGRIAEARRPKGTRPGQWTWPNGGQ